MAFQQVVLVSDPDADTLPAGFTKINNNFSNLESTVQNQGAKED